MSYVVCHIQKFKAGNIVGLQIHSQREKENSINKDIDKSKSNLNYDLHNPTSINFNYKIKDILKQGYKNNKAIRKDAAIMVGTLVSSDKEFFNSLNEEDQRKFFEESYLYFKQRYGENNIVSAVVHMDETTPHMHLYSVPLTPDGRLSGKEIISRATLREIQDELPGHLQSKGFVIERGIEGSNVKHKDTLTFKKEVVNKLNKEIDKYNKLTQSVTERYKTLEGTIGLINNIKPRKSLLGSNLSISKVDYDTLRAKAEIGELSSLKNYDLKSEVKKLKLSLKDIEDKLSSSEIIKKDYEKKNDFLKSSIKDLKLENSLLKFNSSLMLDYLSSISEKDNFIKFIDTYKIGSMIEFENFDSKRSHGIITGYVDDKVIINELKNTKKSITTISLDGYEKLYIDLSRNYIIDKNSVKNKIDFLNKNDLDCIEKKKAIFKEQGFIKNIDNKISLKSKNNIAFER